MARIYDHHWRKARELVFHSQGRRCLIDGPKCTKFATHVDHIVPVEAGGARLDPANLRPACAACNVGRANAEKHREGWRRSNTRIMLVVGPPGSGKSTMVQNSAGLADVVVDYDHLSAALGPELPRGSAARHDVTMAARNAVLTKIRRGEVSADRVWIISTNPNAEGMFPHHEVVLVDPGRDEVMRRAAAGGRPPSFSAIVDDWYARRSTRTGGPSREW